MRDIFCDPVHMRRISADRDLHSKIYGDGCGRPAARYWARAAALGRRPLGHSPLRSVRCSGPATIGGCCASRR
eukprot:2498495-Pleurochrysis_carterae.AAC.1